MYTKMFHRSAQYAYLCRSLHARTTAIKIAYSVPPFTRSCRGIPCENPTYPDAVASLYHETIQRTVLLAL